MIDENKHWIPDDPKLAHLGGNTVGGNPRTFYPELWRWMVDRLKVKDVFDLGCGEGHAMREFERLGCSVQGIDGLQRNVDIANAARFATAICFDITQSTWAYDISVDLMWSCEVIGQIEERFIFNILNVFRRGRFVAMTHQLPGQAGYHVVNAQSHDYWRGAMASIGFTLDKELTRESMQYGHDYWLQSGAIYRKIQ